MVIEQSQIPMFWRRWLIAAASLLHGFWQNAVLNTVFAMLFAIPLAATYRKFAV